MAEYLIQDTTLTAIADAIRFKNDGASDQYLTSEMDDVILELPYANIPSYHYAEAGKIIKKILDFKSTHLNNLVFGTISDSHVYLNDATYGESTAKSIRHGAFALDVVGKMVGCDFVANLGDNCWETGSATGNAYAGSLYVKKATRSAFSEIPCYSLVGNHDRNDNTNTVFELIGSDNEFDDYGLTQIRCYGYKDYTDKKVRIICLNTCDYLNASGGHGMSYEQKDWLMRSLDLSSKSDAANWQILILSHIPVDFTGGDYNIYADLQAILNAYVNGTTATITVNSAYALNETPSNYSTYSGGNLVYNYSGKNAAKIIANIHGHVHTNAYGRMENNDILRMATPNTCFALNKTSSYPDNGGYSISTTEANKLSKVANSVKDTSATFYCVDLDEQVIYAYTYGFDADRYVSYETIIIPTYSVTYNLTNVTSSNMVVTVTEEDAYETTLTAPSGYEIDSVVVTMGGTDITASRYSNGVLSIPEVTGNIVITATAVESVAYTNLFVASDVQTNVRFNSSGEIVSGSFWCVSTYIPAVAGDVIRVYNPNTSFSGFPQRIICSYDSNKGHVSYDRYVGDGTLSSDGLTFTVTVTGSTTQYIRISGNGTNTSGVIITKNEEIV